MLKINSPTPPASSRMRLDAPPDFSSYTRWSGRRTAWSNTRRRTATCTRFVASVARHRPNSPMTSPSTEAARTAATSSASRTRGSIGNGQPPHHGFGDRPAEQHVIDDELCRRRWQEPQHRGNRKRRQRHRDGPSVPSQDVVQPTVKLPQRSLSSPLRAGGARGRSAAGTLATIALEPQSAGEAKANRQRLKSSSSTPRGPVLGVTRDAEPIISARTIPVSDPNPCEPRSRNTRQDS